MKPESLPSLTSLRFFAAMLVVLHHFGAPIRGWEPLDHLLDNGSTGVTFFFILSGFILAYNYPAGGIGLWPFLRARFARIYPIYALGVLLCLPAFLVPVWLWGSAEWPFLRIVLYASFAFLLVQAWHPATSTVMNPPGWSLSAEAFFYSIFPFLAGWRHFRSLVRRPWTGIFLITAVSILFTWLAHEIALRIPAWERVSRDQFVGFSPWVRLPEFAMGALVGWCHADRTLRIPRPALVATSLSVALVVFLSLSPWMAADAYLHNGALAPVYAILVVALAQETGILKRFMSHPALLFLGESSFALYILHYPVWAWMSWLAKHLGHAEFLSSLPGLVAYLAVALGSSAFAYRFIETPARRWLRRS